MLHDADHSVLMSKLEQYEHTFLDTVATSSDRKSAVKKHCPQVWSPTGIKLGAIFISDLCEQSLISSWIWQISTGRLRPHSLLQFKTFLSF